MTFRVIEGDCVEVMPTLAEASIDAIVTDPPYGLEFMGEAWDTLSTPADMQRWHERWAREAYRVLKPGAHVLAFGGTRTYHRLACALEDAGLEVRDSLAWLYGSGFPKSLDVSKALDRAAGAEREVIGEREVWGRGVDRFADIGAEVAVEGNARVPVTAPASAEAQRWAGWGTALKPAHEPIVLARKGLEGTVAANVTAHGTGALNVDGCRIEGDVPQTVHGMTRDGPVFGPGGLWREVTPSTPHPAGRWPANVVIDAEAGALIDAQAGDRGAAAPVRGTEPKAPAFSGNLYGAPSARSDAHPFYADAGGASRFYYTSKADRAEREVGRPYGAEVNTHPTVKPTDLMQWLCRLITPPGGLVLDPFAGSGSTGLAALREGFGFVGIEREHKYVMLARARITGDGPLFNVEAEVP